MAGGGGPGSADAIAPFMYGRWDNVARAHHAAQQGRRNDTAAVAFGSPGAFDPARTRAALAALQTPVLVLAGGVDVNSSPPAMTEVAAVHGNARLVVQPGAGHSPWLDNPRLFTATVEDFLAEA